MIYLTRHGNRHDQHDKKWRSNCEFSWDTPICPTHFPAMLNQAETLKDKIEVVYSSPFVRAMQTAWVYADVCSVPICIEGSLSECLKEKWFPNPESFQLLTTSELARNYPQVDQTYQSRFDPKPPEGRRHCRRRVSRFLDWLIPQNSNCLLVGHGFSIKDCKVRLGMDAHIPPKGVLLTPPNQD